jgi:mRNA interferase MazF
MPPRYIPRVGDLITIDFDPQTGREEAKRRPAIVLSPANYNAKAGLALVCPITSRIKGYPFEVILPSNLKATGAILVDQIKSLDWQTRSARYIGPSTEDVVEEIRARLRALLGL